MNLKGKKALITGGSAGLGLDIAKLLKEKGVCVHICSRPSEKLEKLRTELESELCTIYGCDVTDVSGLQEMQEEIGEIDILINNAGVWLDGEFKSYSFEQIQKVIEVNLIGLINVTKVFLPAMKHKEEGLIVNVSSTLGLRGRAGTTVYSASKWGVKGFTESLKEEVHGTGMKVIGFYPGGMKTELFEKGGSDRDTSEFMETKDVAEVLVFALERPGSMMMDEIKVSRTK